MPTASAVLPAAPALQYRRYVLGQDTRVDRWRGLGSGVLEIPDCANLDPTVEELRGFRVLLLDHSDNIHSMWRKEAFLTKSYWDYMATLAHLSPPGCIGILGLGAGTVANMVSQHYPGTKMQGWEIDPVVVEASRLCFGVTSLEKEGSLVVHVGDALLRSSPIEGGFSSIMVDLYGDGVLLQQLLHVEAWQSIHHRLRGGIGGRVMANLGMSPRPIDGWPVHEDSVTTIKALSCMLEVFDDEVNVLHIRNMDGPRTMNVLALTGPLEGLQEAWVEGLPIALRHLAADYRWERWESNS
eukprot:gene5702-17598_t